MKIKRLKGEFLLNGFNINAGGGDNGPDSNSSVENDFTGAWTSEDKSMVADQISEINTVNSDDDPTNDIAVHEQSFTNDVNARAAEQAATHKSVFSFLNPLAQVVNPVLGLVTKSLQALTTPTTQTAVNSLTPGVNKGADMTNGENNSGGNSGDIQTDTQKAQTEATTSSEETDETTSISSGEITLQAEAAAEAARAEERAKARKRVGLYSMRHTDPFGMFDLPDIFTPGGHA